MKKLSFLLAMMIICSSVAYSGTIDRQRVVNSKSFLSFTNNPKELNSIQNADNITTSFILNGSAGEKIFTNPMPNLTITDFPISENQLGTIDLKRIRSVVDRNTTFTVRTADGAKQVEGPAVYSYFGKIRGSENSMVMLNYCDGELVGLVEHENGQKYNIIPFGENGDYGDNNTKASNVVHSVVSDGFGKDEFSEPFICGTEEEPTDGIISEEDIKSYNNNYIQKESDLLVVGVIVECAFDFYELRGESTSRVIAYVEQIVNLASKIYEENINVALHLNGIIINEDFATDPYYKKTKSLGEKLSTMGKYWQANYRKKKRAIAVLFANIRQEQGGLIAGIAQRGQTGYGVLCNKSMGYAVVGMNGNYPYPQFNYTADVATFSHETGHNFSSPHTHSCLFDPPIDTCAVNRAVGNFPPIGDACTDGDIVPRPGTIMSYCHAFNGKGTVGLYYHKRVKPIIRKAADRAKRNVFDSCVFKPLTPLLKLLSPLGSETFTGGGALDIRWTQQNVNTIEILFSSDNGQNWQSIAKNIAAEDTIYKWNVPTISSKNCLIMVVDDDNPEVLEMSILPFEIQVAMIEITSSLVNKRVGQRSRINLQWDKTLVNEVNILFSSDGGDNWETIKSGVNSKVLNINVFEDIPGVESENCLFRIEDSQNSSIFSESDVFAIGKEVAEIKRPSPGSTVCTNESIVNQYKYQIRWTSDFLDKINIELFDGSKWKKINGFIAIDASKKSYYDWEVPANIKTNEARLRIQLYSDKTFIVDTSESFILDDCLTGVDDGNQLQSSTLRILDIIPNPAHSEASIKISSSNANIHTVDMMLVDEAGNVAAVLGKFDIAGTGESTFNIRTSNVAQGSYFIVIQSGEARATAPIRIIR